MKRHAAEGNPKKTKSAPGMGERSNLVKDPEDWVSGDEPMTGAQASYLKTLSEEASEPFDGDLTKAQASERIEALKAKTGRAGAQSQGRDHPSGS